MVKTESEYTRGKNSAFARIDSQGVERAKEWIERRMADTTRYPLSPAYIKGYFDTLELERGFGAR